MDQTVCLWDTTTGKEEARYNGNFGFLRGVAFSPDGRFIAFGAADGMVRLLDLSR